MTHDPQKLHARRKRLTRTPHVHRFTQGEIGTQFGAAKPNDIAFVDLLPTAGAAASVLAMTNPTDGAGYISAGNLPLFSAGGPVIHDVLQGQVSDCYALACWAGMALLRPDTVVAQIARAAANIRTRWNSGGVDTWLEQDAMLPNSAARWMENTWVAFYEKAYAYWRTRANTYASLNFGNPTAPFGSLGWSNVGYFPSNSAWSAAARAISGNFPVAVLTVAKVSGAPLVGSHAYALVSVNTDNTLSLYNPWGIDGVGDGSNSDDGVVTITLAQALANLSYVVCTTGYTQPTLPPEKPMMSVPPAGILFTADRFSGIFGCTLEMQSGKPDIGYVTPGGWVEYALTVASADVYALTTQLASIADSSLAVLANGVEAATISIPSRAGWQVFKPITINVNLPAGAVILRFSRRSGQYNIGDVSLALPATPSPSPPSPATPAKKPRIIVYDDFSTGVYVPNL